MQLRTRPRAAGATAHWIALRASFIGGDKSPPFHHRRFARIVLSGPPDTNHRDAQCAEARPPDGQALTFHPDLQRARRRLMANAAPRIFGGHAMACPYNTVAAISFLHASAAAADRKGPSARHVSHSRCRANPFDSAQGKRPRRYIETLTIAAADSGSNVAPARPESAAADRRGPSAWLASRCPISGSPASAAKAVAVTAGSGTKVLESESAQY